MLKNVHFIHQWCFTLFPKLIEFKQLILIKLCREQERKVGPEGFLDSSRYSHQFSVKKQKGRANSLSAKPSTVSLSSRISKDKKDYEKRMKVIEVCDLKILKLYCWIYLFVCSLLLFTFVLLSYSQNWSFELVNIFPTKYLIEIMTCTHREA